MRLATRTFLLLCVFACVPFGAFAQQRTFSEAETKRIKCADEKITALYNFLDASAPPDKKEYSPTACGESDKAIQTPKWLEESLQKEMATRNLWVIPNAQTGGTDSLSEAEVWRKIFHILSEFFAFVEDLNEGRAYQQQEIMEKFGNIRTRFLIETERLNTNPDLIGYDMRSSMQGRGRSLIATLDLINSEMDSVAESFLSSPKLQRTKFKQSVLGTTTLANNLYADIMKTNRLQMPETYKKTSGMYVLVLVLMGVGMFAVFIGTLKFMDDRNEELNQMFQRYMQKTTIWADDYSRQFIDINIKGIVFSTLGFFSIFGLLIGFAVGGFIGFIFFAVLFGFGLYAGLKMPGIVLNYLKVKRGQRINAQLMDALILLSNSLKSGMDIVQGFEMVSKDLRPPISDEFGLVIKNYKLGTPFEKALEGMEERVASRLLSYMVKAIVLQRQVGGNLTKIFERIVENIREESKLEEKLQAMTAQQRIQAIVVAVMPGVMVSIMFLFQPDTMINFYTKPIGLIIFFMCAIWIGIGIKLVNKLGEIKV